MFSSFKSAAFTLKILIYLKVERENHPYSLNSKYTMVCKYVRCIHKNLNNFPFPSLDVHHCIFHHWTFATNTISETPSTWNTKTYIISLKDSVKFSVSIITNSFILLKYVTFNDFYRIHHC